MWEQIAKVLRDLRDAAVIGIESLQLNTVLGNGFYPSTGRILAPTDGEILQVSTLIRNKDECFITDVNALIEKKRLLYQ